MNKILTGALAGVVAAGALAAAVPASARDWDHGGRGHYRHGDSGAAVAAGIVGLAIGAALASGGRHDDYGYSYSYGPPARYDYGPAPDYYAGPTYDAYERRCRMSWRWDPYLQEYVRVRACY